MRRFSSTSEQSTNIVLFLQRNARMRCLFVQTLHDAETVGTNKVDSFSSPVTEEVFVICDDCHDLGKLVVKVINPRLLRRLSGSLGEKNDSLSFQNK